MRKREGRDGEENQLCRDLMAPESQSEIEEKHRPSPIGITEVLKKPHSSF